MRTATTIEASAGKNAVEFAVEAERLGLDVCWVAEAWGADAPSPLGYLAARTERMLLGSGVIQVGTRSPVTIAQTAMTLAHLSDAMTVIKGLAEGREVTHHGQPLRIPWVRDGKLEIWMAAYGPKALKLTGEQADGFILQTADPDIARWTIGSVRAAAQAAGRDPGTVKICVAAPAYVGTDLAHQREQLRWFGGMVGNHVADLVARYGTDGPVPKELTDYIKGREGYDYAHHGKADNPMVDFVPDEIVDRFCLTGPAGAHVDRLRELAAMGVDQFSVYLMHDQEEQTLAAYRDEVIPALR